MIGPTRINAPWYQNFLKYGSILKYNKNLRFLKFGTQTIDTTPEKTTIFFINHWRHNRKIENKHNGQIIAYSQINEKKYITQTPKIREKITSKETTHIDEIDEQEIIHENIHETLEQRVEMEQKKRQETDNTEILRDYHSLNYDRTLAFDDIKTWKDLKKDRTSKAHFDKVWLTTNSDHIRMTAHNPSEKTDLKERSFHKIKKDLHKITGEKNRKKMVVWDDKDQREKTQERRCTNCHKVGHTNKQCHLNSASGGKERSTEV